MHEIMKLKEMLMKELEEFGSKGELTAGSLETIDKLAHAVKNLCKVIEAYEDEEYSERGGSYNMGGGGSYRYSREGGNRGGGQGGYSRDYSREGGSYARGRGRNAQRDSMGRYSRGGDPNEMVEQLEQLMQDAPNEQIKQGIQKLVQQVEQMM